MLTVLRPQGKPVSGVLSFYFRGEVLPYYAGDLVNARELAANDFKYWELMRRACERGCKIFDYGRSKRDSGSFDFKKNWGFEAEAAALRVPAVQARRDPAEQSRRIRSTARSSGCGAGCRVRLTHAIGPAIARNLG